MEEAKTMLEKCQFLLELEDEEDFEVILIDRSVSTFSPYRLVNGRLYNALGESASLYDDGCIYKKIPKPWEPNDGDVIYCINQYGISGYKWETYVKWEGYTKALKRKMIFRTEEEAIARVKELGWSD